MDDDRKPLVQPHRAAQQRPRAVAAVDRHIARAQKEGAGAILILKTPGPAVGDLQKAAGAGGVVAEREAAYILKRQPDAGEHLVFTDQPGAVFGLHRV